MKYCPICEKEYQDEAQVCAIDGAALRQSGVVVDDLTGKVIKGRYQVNKKIGDGGMGTVYLAEQVSIGRKIALKVLHGHYAKDEEFVRRFRSEARLAASLNHRNVVTIYDFDQTLEGNLFIAMEYVNGKNLKELLQQGPLDVARAVRLATQVADGLGAAHSAGFIHRDIKPENIMVSAEGDQAKLMDFGIARLRDSGETRLTRSGAIIGTPAYMAPEQIEGREVTERSDIYSFGIVLYEMLTGTVPFKGPTPSAVIMKHLHEAPVPVRSLRKEIPPALERVISQALEKPAEKRQSSMREVEEGLQNAQPPGLTGDAAKVSAAPISVSPTPQAREPWKLKLPRFSLPVAISVTIALLAIVMFNKFVQEEHPNKPAPPLAVVESPNLAPGDAARGTPKTAPERVVPETLPEEPRSPIVLAPKSPETAKRVDAPLKAKAKEQQAAPPPAFERKLPSVNSGGAELARKPAPEFSPAEKSERVRVAEPTASKNSEHIKLAKAHRERGEYSEALSELEKARAADPTDQRVQAELAATRRACVAEQKLGRSDLNCG